MVILARVFDFTHVLEHLSAATIHGTLHFTSYNSWNPVVEPDFVDIFPPGVVQILSATPPVANGVSQQAINEERVSTCLR